MSQRSFYDVLGVDPSATAPEIRQAYRRLAQRWHPDRHRQSKAASDRFIELKKAYETLGNPSRRLAYDESRQRPKEAPQNAPPPVVTPALRRKGDDLHVSVSVALAELYGGTQAKASGWVGKACPFCSGGCPKCGFAGQVLTKRSWTVEVPPGHRPSQLLRFSGAGHTGPFFDQPGDVYLSLRPSRSNGWRWSYKRHRVERTIRVPGWFLRAGGQVELRSPQGEWGVVDIPASSALSGWVRVRKLGLGAPEPEDAWIRLRVGLWFSWGTRRLSEQ